MKPPYLATRRWLVAKYGGTVTISSN